MCLAFVGAANACGTKSAPRICYLRNYDRTHLAKHPDQTVTNMRISLSLLPPVNPTSKDDYYIFDLNVQFREDKDNWSWTSGGMRLHYGPGLTCAVIEDGCDVTGDDKHFYINHKNPKSIYLYPRSIKLFHRANNDISRILTGGKDDEIFRLRRVLINAGLGRMSALGANRTRPQPSRHRHHSQSCLRSAPIPSNWVCAERL